MALSEKNTKNSFNAFIADGTGSDGTPKYKSVGIGTLSTNGDDWNSTKAMKIANALGAVYDSSTSYGMRTALYRIMGTV